MLLSAIMIPAWVDPVFTLLLKTAAGAVVAYLLPKIPQATQHLMGWASAQASNVHNDYVRGVLQRLSNLVGERVLAAENTAIEDLKDAVATGNMSVADLKAALAKVKTDVVAQVKADATAQGLWTNIKFIFDDEGALMNWIFSLVETHVATLAPSGLQTSKDGSTPPAVEAAPAPVASNP